MAAEEEEARSKGLGIRLLPASAADAEQAASVKFAHHFDRNRRNRRAEIRASSIFSAGSVSQNRADLLQKVSRSSLPSDKLHLLAKKRRMDMLGVRDLLIGKVKPSSKSLVLSSSQNGVVKPSVRIIQKT